MRGFHTLVFLGICLGACGLAWAADAAVEAQEEASAARQLTDLDHSTGTDESSAVDDKEMRLSLRRLAELEQELENGGGQDDVSPITAGWDKKKGFFIRDADDNFLLRVYGRMQIRYTYKARDKRGSSSSDHDNSYFELERLRFGFRGHVLDPRLTYNLQFDGDTDRDGGVTTLDAYAKYDVLDGDQAKMVYWGGGQWKVKFLRQESTSSGKQQLVDRSLANEYFNVDRVLGTWFEGDVGPVYYSVAVTNGFNSANRGIESDQVPGFMGKFDYNLFGEYGYSEADIKISEDLNWVIGTSLASDVNNGTGSTGAPEYKVYQFGVDTGVKYQGFSFQSEYMGRWLDYQSDPTATDPDIIDGRNIYSHGFYAQGGFMLNSVVEDLAPIEIVSRGSAVYGNEGANDGKGFMAGGGINWYINGHKFKFQTDVFYFDIPGNMPRASTNLEKKDPSDPPESSFSAIPVGPDQQGVLGRVQFQLAF